VAIVISLAVSLSITPMMCAYLLADPDRLTHGRLYLAGERIFEAVLMLYGRTLRHALHWPGLVTLSLLTMLGSGIYLSVIIPKGFVPQQDNGLIMGGLFADQSTSFHRMQQKLTQFLEILRQDPAVETVSGSTGSGQTNDCFVYAALKPLSERKVSAEQVMAGWRRKLSEVSTTGSWLQVWPEIWIGGHWSQYQYTLLADNTADISNWAAKVELALRKVPLLTDVNLDQQQGGIETNLIIDRGTAARLGLAVSQIDNTLYDAFGQRQVSTIYAAQNQYHVVMEVAPEFWQNPETLSQIYVSTSGGPVSGAQATQPLIGTVFAKAPTRHGSGTTGATKQKTGETTRNLANNAIANTKHGATSTGAAVSTSPETMVPLSAFAHFDTGNTPLSVNHEGLSVAATISFNLAPGVSLSEATAAIEDQMRQLDLPSSIHGGFQGTTKVFQQSLANEPYLIAAALLAVYIVLGVLYESYVHPITILSTLPSAGVGAVLALIATDTEFSIVALIGVILLIGIVIKNAIMMIDFALVAERGEGLSSREAIYQACLKRFRPIMMTTMAAMLGAVPLAIGFGEGAELRRPLGISIVGGLLVSQMLTLYTTPVIYVYLDRFRVSARRRWRLGLIARRITEPEGD
jgi:multidrug efflux pump